MHQKQRVSQKYFIPPSREAPAGCNGAGEAPGECDAERSSVDKTGGRIEATGRGVFSTSNICMVIEVVYSLIKIALHVCLNHYY
jgi:hypothetical protein